MIAQWPGHHGRPALELRTSELGRVGPDKVNGHNGILDESLPRIGERAPPAGGESVVRRVGRGERAPDPPADQVRDRFLAGMLRPISGARIDLQLLRVPRDDGRSCVLELHLLESERRRGVLRAPAIARVRPALVERKGPVRPRRSSGWPSCRSWCCSRSLVAAFSGWRCSCCSRCSGSAGEARLRDRWPFGRARHRAGARQRAESGAELKDVEVGRSPNEVDEEGSAFQRYEIWRVARDSHSRAPGGRGRAGRVPGVSPRYRAAPDIRSDGAGARDTHSTYLNVTAETGLVGAPIFFGTYVIALFRINGGAQAREEAAAGARPSCCTRISPAQ